MSLTLGSLFDGIGGFPLAGIRNGIIPLWASEIETFPISVTKIHFPRMLHVGDIVKLNGADLPPVDIVTGGSPCQDLSIASGSRAGLAGERSGLFMEQIRIVKEMRIADERRGRSTLDVRPRYMVWENVPGAFSSGTPLGEDFRIVLEETIRIADDRLSVPRPPHGRWKYAGAVLGDQCSLAWRVLDTQYWPGTPQRRRRIFLVIDFGGFTAPKILFEQDGLFGNSSPVEGERQGTAGATQGSTDISGGIVAFACNQRDEARDLHDISAAICAHPGVKQQTFVVQSADSKCLTPWDRQSERISRPDGISPTLAGADGGGGRNPAGLIFTAGFCAGASPTARSIGYQDECAPTLKAGESGTNMVPSVLCLNDQGGRRMDVFENKVGTLRAQMDGHPPLVLTSQQSGIEIRYDYCSTTASASGTSGNNQPILFENHGIDSRYTGPHKVAPTMSARYGTGGNNVPLVSQGNTYCIAGNIIDRQTKNGGNGFGCQSDIAYTLTGVDRHAVFSRPEPYQQIVGTLCRGDEKGIGNQYISQDKCIIERPNLIRRLTPLECERLMGFPDGWTDIGGSDSARYKALGNSVAIPCVDYVLRGIAFYLRQKKLEVAK
ncbi:DNA cytosine methyltransferase [Oscillospiraceae bacterium OttesenSCG-928-G22]|nr:DNA cytosine methyltransferase [Oscillospiraceae bacterium OttesenSCG-928-G22]